MGTNYYVPIDKCGKCGRSEDDLHIGKSSGGWKFLFRLYKDEEYDDLWHDYDSLIEWLKDKQIEDDLGDNVSLDEFMQMVESKQDGLDIDTYHRKTPQHIPQYYHLVPQEDKEFYIGEYRFTRAEFS